MTGSYSAAQHASHARGVNAADAAATHAVTAGGVQAIPSTGPALADHGPDQRKKSANEVSIRDFSASLVEYREHLIDEASFQSHCSNFLHLLMGGRFESSRRISRI